MGPVVAKFGGSSLADSTQFRKVKEIIKADSNRRFIVPSAPGKTCPEDTKVTDLLYLLRELYRNHQDTGAVEESIRNKYEEIAQGIGISLDFTAIFDKIMEELSRGACEEYMASRGEYINGLLLSEYLGFEFIDPKELIFFDSKGRLDDQLTESVMRRRLNGVERAVIPGFYGALPDGRIKTFSRGGSDLTGSLVARAVDASLYENWTDVSGFLLADPKIVKNPRGIQKISYRELRELSYMGAGILHDEAIFPVVSKGIPIQIKNTNAPKEAGTMILGDRKEEEEAGPVTGIAGRKGFSVIMIQKVRMNSDLSFQRRVLGILEAHGVYLEHMPSSIDTLSLIIQDDADHRKVKEVIADIKAVCRPDSIGFTKNISLITVVGRGMKRTTGTSAILFSALGRAGINVRLIVQGSSEINIIVGVRDEDYERAIQAIYEGFIKPKEDVWKNEDTVF